MKHYYFHLIDPEWGHVTLRMCGYPPFGTQVILNGHEWVERQAVRQKVTVAKSGNCFVEGSDFAQVNRLAALLQRESAIGKLAAVCERWIYSSALCFALTREKTAQGFDYEYSVFQLELSRNLLFVRVDNLSGPKRYSVRQAAYDLAKLRGKKLVRRKDQSRRYVSDPNGVRTMCADFLLRKRSSNPCWRGDSPDWPSPQSPQPLGPTLR